MEWIDREVKRGDRFLDIGANMGNLRDFCGPPCRGGGTRLCR